MTQKYIYNHRKLGDQSPVVNLEKKLLWIDFFISNLKIEKTVRFFYRNHFDKKREIMRSVIFFLKIGTLSRFESRYLITSSLILIIYFDWEVSAMN